MFCTFTVTSQETAINQSMRSLHQSILLTEFCVFCLIQKSLIKSSGTFVVDARNLKCLDDIKKDEFGMWDYSGSHPQAYEVYHKDCGYMSIEKCGNGATGPNVVYLRRLHCTHPSNPEFKRLICFVTGEVDFFTFTYCMYNYCVHTMYNCCVLTCMID